MLLGNPQHVTRLKYCRETKDWRKRVAYSGGGGGFCVLDALSPIFRCGKDVCTKELHFKTKELFKKCLDITKIIKILVV